MKTTTPLARPLKLSDMGTSGLLQWIAAGESAAQSLRSSQAVFRLRTGKAAKIIAARYGEESATVFRKVALREHKTRAAVARLAAGGVIACHATTYEARETRLTIRELCRRAGRDFEAAVSAARHHVATAPGDVDTSNARAFLAAI